MTVLPDVPGGHTAYGVTVHAIGEDADALVAFGHIDHRRFFAACQAAARNLWGWNNLGDDIHMTWADIQAEISHDHAFYNPQPEESEYAWTIDWGQPADTPGTIPITIWTAS